jgi:AcrR family transcriptional regulator
MPNPYSAMLSFLAQTLDKIRLERLDAVLEPAGMDAARDAVAALLPRIDYPELILEVAERTGMFGQFAGTCGEPRQIDLRADAARNYLRIVEAAHSAFSRGGLDVPMEEIAAEAGVGVATVYRRFPTKGQLVKAMLNQRFTEAIAPALERALREADPRKALRLVPETGLGLASQEQITFAVAAYAGVMTMDLARRFFEPVSMLVRRGQEAGVFRADLVPEDTPRLMLMLVGTPPSIEPRSDGWRRYLELLLDGLAPAAAADLPAPLPVRDHHPWF